MSEHFQYLKEGLAADLVNQVMEDFHLDMEKALDVVYSSALFEKLSKPETGLYKQGPVAPTLLFLKGVSAKTGVFALTLHFFGTVGAGREEEKIIAKRFIGTKMPGAFASGYFCGDKEIRKFTTIPFIDPCFNGFYCVFLQTELCNYG